MPRKDTLGAILGDLVLSLFDARRRELGLAVGRPRYGYKNIGPAGRKRVVPDPETRAWGKKLIELRERGFRDRRGRRIERPSWREIVLYLWHCNAQRPDGKEFSEGCVRRWAAAEQRLQELEVRQRETKCP